MVGKEEEGMGVMSGDEVVFRGLIRFFGEVNGFYGEMNGFYGEVSGFYGEGGAIYE
jgi:hypothetical protein